MSAPLVTVAFLLYNAEKSVVRLLETLLKQKHPAFRQQSEWLRVIFVNDKSKDGTADLLKKCLKAIENPSYIEFLDHPENFGLSKTVNQVIGLTETPTLLTCHCDCFFESETYIADMLRLMDENPKTAAITGSPVVDFSDQVAFSERVNLVSNLMDLFPPQGSELVPVGFAEGRCDIFRVEALKQVGLYDTNLRTAGEDQVLCARLRNVGYQIRQAPQCRYFLSVSTEQDSIVKIAKHQQLFGQAHPYILAMARGSHQGVSTKHAGNNRQKRLLLRGTQLLSVPAYLAGIILILFYQKYLIGFSLLYFIFYCRYMIFRQHLHKVNFTPKELLLLFLYQPLFDFAYALGLVQGVWHLGSVLVSTKTILGLKARH
jgi:GT2 family glycosyltransferase